MHTDARSSSPRIPSCKIALGFIIWFQIQSSAFTVHMDEGNERLLLLSPLFRLSTSRALSELWPHISATDADEIGKKTGRWCFVREPLRSSFIFLFAVFKAALSPSFLKGLDMLSGLCIPNGWGWEERDLSVDSGAGTGYWIETGGSK